MDINLKSLIAGLNDTCRNALEGAAGLCLSKGNYDVDLEHYLLTLIEPSNTDLSKIFRCFEVDLSYLKKDITSSLENLKTGNNRTPSLSPRLPELISDAWLLSTVEYGESKIRSGHLLLAMLANSKTSRIAIDISKEFALVSVETLKQRMRELTSGSSEEKDVTGFGGGGAISKSNGSLGITGSTKTLDQYTIDLTARANAGLIDPVLGRDREIRQIIDVLMRRRQNNPILTGEAGVGKTAVVEGFALCVAIGDVPPPLKNISVRTLDLGLLQAGAGIKGEFENRLKSVIEEVKSSPQPIILFIDEAHTMIGAGGQAGQNDAANLLKPALARGELRTIAATTWSEYKKYFEKDAALARRFQVIKVEEPSEEDAVLMMRGLVTILENHHNVKILDDAVVDSVKLSHRYISDRQLPDKSVSVLDTACARKAINGFMSNHDNEIVPPPVFVDSHTIAEVISGWTGIPVGKMLSNEVHTVLQLNDQLSTRVKGQGHALEAISKRIRTSRANLTDPRRPVGIFFLVGPSGIGKTETALALADAMYGGEKNLITINMSEYQEAHTVSSLKGSPPGYIGYGEGGVLTEAVRRKPYSVVLLDEVEKAHPDVMELFYQVFDRGMLEDGEGREIDFKNCIILLTSNVAQDNITQLCMNPNEFPDSESIVEAIRPRLLKIFKPALLGRMVVIPYYPLSDDVMREIIKIQLRRIATRIAENHNADLCYDEIVIDEIAQRCVEVESGARNVDHILTNTLLPEMSGELLSRMVSGMALSKVHVGIDDSRNFTYRFV